MAERLGVWLDGVRVADLERRAANRIACRYTEEALDLWPQNSPVLSCGLPLSSRPQDALAFCRGLLPEGNALLAMAQQAGLAANDAFGLLARYGRDVAGALVVSAQEPDERRFDVQAYTPGGLEEALEELDDHPLGLHDDSELSLAGLQDKLLLVELDAGSWGRPLRGLPSTHILKLDDQVRPGLVEAEAHCLQLARAAGLTDIDIKLEAIGNFRCLIVTRFDRAPGPGGTRRIHQEDLCQALGVDSEDRRRRAKYERAGGPSFRQAARLLDSYAEDPAAELDRLAAVVAFTVLIGNADAHGKNLALLHPTAERVRLAPLYDTVPTALWPRLRREAAMSIGAQVVLADVTMSDIGREARAWRHPEDRARTAALATIAAVTEAIESEAIPPDSPVARFVRRRAAELTGNHSSRFGEA